MRLLHRYILLYFLRIFLIINLVIFIITAIYGLADIFLSFRETSPKVGAKYVLFLIPFVFYYLSPLSYTSAGLIVLKRLADRKVDLTSQSFGISPYNLLSPLVILVIGISAFHLIMNEKVYPSVYKEIKYIEEKYKIKRSVSKRIAQDIWFLKQVGKDRIYVYIQTVEIDSGKFLNMLMIRVSDDDRVKDITEGRYGVWKGTKINIGDGFYYNFIRAGLNEKLNNKVIEIGFDLEEISLLAERIEFLPSSSLILLFSKGREIGIDINQYMGELLYRAGTSLFPFFIFIPVASNFLLSRKMRRSLLLFFIVMVAGWSFITMSKILPSEAKTTPLYVLIPYTLMLLYSLKRLYDLRKGYRV